MNPPGDPGIQRPTCVTIVADFAGPGGLSGGPLRAEPGEFQALLRALRPGIELRTPDVLTGASRQVAWRATLESIRDLDPEPLLARCPASAPLLAWHRHLLQVTRAGTGTPALLEALDNLWPEVPRAARHGGERPITAVPRAESGIDALLDAIQDGTGAMASGPTRGPVPLGTRERLQGILEARSVAWETRLRQARTAAEQALVRQAEAILHDPVLRDREAAWRCLWAVMEDADLRRGDLRLQIVQVAREECAVALEEFVRTCEEAWGGMAAPGLVAIDHAAGDDAVSAEILKRAASASLRLRSRVVLPLDPAFLGEGADHASARPAGIADLVSSDRLSPARAALVRAPGSNLVLTCNRFLFRAPWSPDEGPSVLGAGREDAGLPGGPYAHAIWIAVRGVARAVRSGGPEAAHALDAARVGGIATRLLGSPASPGHVTPVEFMLGAADADLLVQAGLAPLTAELDQDTVTLRGLLDQSGRERTTAGESPGRPAPGMTARFDFPARKPEDGNAPPA